MNKIISIFSQKKGSTVESILAPHINDLYRQAYHYTGDRDSAEDLLQDLFVYICQEEETLRNLDPVKPWLKKCLYHRFVDNHRKQKRRVEEVPLDNEEHHAVSDQISLETLQMRDRVIKSLTELSTEQRAAIILFDIEGQSLREVAEILEISVGTVKSHLHRGRKKLKILLDVAT